MRKYTVSVDVVSQSTIDRTLDGPVPTSADAIGDRVDISDHGRPMTAIRIFFGQGVLTLKDMGNGTLTGTIKVGTANGDPEKIGNGRISNGTNFYFDTEGGGHSHWVGVYGQFQGKEVLSKGKVTGHSTAIGREVANWNSLNRLILSQE